MKSQTKCAPSHFDVRCSTCNKKLGEFLEVKGSIKCDRCKKVNVIDKVKKG